jgi:glycosyltransferase involved in cell wall biosynthesis
MTVVFAGRLIDSKRLDVFVKGLAIAVKDSPGIRGLVVGSGPDEQAGIELARQLNLHNLEFLGERHDVPSILANADVLVSCSESEGCPNVILEAMAARLPVVTTPAGDSELLIEDGQHGYVFPFGEYQLLAERLIHLAANPEERTRMGQVGRQRVCQWHHYDGLAHRLLSIYNQIAEDRDIRNCRRMIREALAGAAAAGETGSY